MSQLDEKSYAELLLGKPKPKPKKKKIPDGTKLKE